MAETAREAIDRAAQVAIDAIRAEQQRVAPWREAHPRDAIQRIADRPCDIFVDPFTCISENAPENEVCDPCRLIASGAHDVDWDLLA